MWPPNVQGLCAQCGRAQCEWASSVRLPPLGSVSRTTTHGFDPRSHSPSHRTGSHPGRAAVCCPTEKVCMAVGYSRWSNSMPSPTTVGDMPKGSQTREPETTHNSWLLVRGRDVRETAFRTPRGQAPNQPPGFAASPVVGIRSDWYPRRSHAPRHRSLLRRLSGVG